MLSHQVFQAEQERRTKPRVCRPFHARVRGVDALGSFDIATVLDNLSATGLYMKLPRIVEKGAKLSITIRLSTSQADHAPAAQIAVNGVVVRTESLAGGWTGLGVEIMKRRFIS